MNKILQLILIDIFRNRVVIAYTILLALACWSIFFLEDSGNKALVTMLNLELLVIPLISILFSTIYIYNSSEFIELLLSQPIKRSQIWISLFFGLVICLLAAYIVAIIPPLLLFGYIQNALWILLGGILITVIFISIGFLISIQQRDKAKGIGTSLLVWLFFALLFDGLVLFILFQFGDYPIEKPMVLVSMLSPIDLLRIMNLMQLDASAMMGYTGAIFQQYFGSTLGTLVTLFVLVLWALIPFLISLRIFKRKDL
ncbi:MAG: ABC transporter permease [Sediminibacterium sp.]|nr:ABC transporter permease [Hydrotalea sp.]MCU0336241.1 ABC transporter permease [Sediminibacterium sp.]